MPTSWRLLNDLPADGAWNMAVDEALLERYAGSDEPLAPTLRLYAWSRACLSLGRHQPVLAAYLRPAAIELVRRPTGGLAVLHEHETTYAVVGQLRHGPFPGGALDTYRRVAQALQRALGSLGVEARAQSGGTPVAPRAGAPACFEATTAHEISVRGRKLVGSAQCRRRRAFLQHGSILLRADPCRLARALGRSTGAPGGDRDAPFVDIETVLGRAVRRREIDRALLAGFMRSFGCVLVPGTLTPAERECAASLRNGKYASPAWTLDAAADRVPISSDCP